MTYRTLEIQIDICFTLINKKNMYHSGNFYRTNCWLLICICTCLSLIANNAVAINAATTTNIANGTPAITNYHHQSANYKDTAAPTITAITAAMTAAALPVAETAKDYSQPLSQHYPGESPINAATNIHTLGSGSNMAAELLYRNYFDENSEVVDRVKIGSTTLISRDKKEQWRTPIENSEHQSKRSIALTEDEKGKVNEAPMTVAGFLPTTVTAAGQHYISHMTTSLNNAHESNNYAEHNVGGVKSTNNREGGGLLTNSYAYIPPIGKIDYEINEDNYEHNNNNNNMEVNVGIDESDSFKMRTDDPYEQYKYNINEYTVKQMERAQEEINAHGSVNNVRGRYEATTDVDSSNQGVGSYFDNGLPGYENYFMPTYQIEQFSNYNNEEERNSEPIEQHQQQHQHQHQQHHTKEYKQQKSNREIHEQPHLRPLALFNDGGDDDKNAMLQQQFNKGRENIENYVNDRQKLRYYTKQPQLQRARQQYDQQQQQQQQRLLQQQLKEQNEHVQQQQIQLSHQLREFPQLMQFTMQHQHLPPLQHRQQPSLTRRPNYKTSLSARRQQQQHQLQHQKRDSVSLQMIGNVERRSLLPTLRNIHIDNMSRSSDGISSMSSSSSSSTSIPTNINNNDVRHNKKNSISKIVDDSTNSPSQFHYEFTQSPTYVSQLVDDSVNEIDDTHNNIDVDNGSIDDSTTNTNNKHNHDQYQYFVTMPTNQHKENVQFKKYDNALIPEYTLTPIDHTIKHTPASTAIRTEIPLSRHVEVTKHIPIVTDYQRIHVPYNQSVPIEIPQPIVTAIPRPYEIRIPVTKVIAVPRVKEVRIPVEKVKTFPVERPVPFVVERRVPYMVEKQIAKPYYYNYPVQVPIVKTIVHKVPRLHHHYPTYQQHSTSYPFTLGQYHLQRTHNIHEMS